MSLAALVFSITAAALTPQERSTLDFYIATKKAQTGKTQGQTPSLDQLQARWRDLGPRAESMITLINQFRPELNVMIQNLNNQLRSSKQAVVNPYEDKNWEMEIRTELAQKCCQARQGGEVSKPIPGE